MTNISSDESELEIKIVTKQWEVLSFNSGEEAEEYIANNPNLKYYSPYKTPSIAHVDGKYCIFIEST